MVHGKIKSMDKVNILGVNVDNINMEGAKDRVVGWLRKDSPASMRNEKHYIVTPNPEFVMAAQKDPGFKDIINKADLAIPDGIGLRLRGDLESTISGVDLMERLVELSSDLGATVGFLGGEEGVAKRCAECLQKKYPGLKISFAEDGGKIDDEGNWVGIKKPVWEPNRHPNLNPTSLPDTDILFVAFGQVKQEKWIYKNLPKIPVKIAMGVGGAFDEISGKVPRIPSILHKMGLKWLFRLILEPWRIKRQLALVRYVWKILTG
ncbi:MAG: N-acetylglucosaminyldiphosphoundecaprenol N-acetyl-beta-D-mannosaminyltransferase [Candidatus Curtissbacteria bacterium GW2011_GWA1_41_11]|uniref:N-acetylglucosaminyldiphosphoundecaprenol N-acetyl-beta-D-mannosaminyltransferase n=3 Tax=Microgenomates group TaxID=1794810 RepID=A0A0G0YSJ3_9BACT|nr:MAG: N-acetylglucosaminyldiphosphoundecaprenol N-acetyl-beta-D-mannosaminyltransferase [Candidatus Curtissbacteria bacterium GW2011_GWA1_41_11]KKS12651.1 MAG: N-acetylglucosaminyldiphosphoundecaprenol N-acetyl-beta-D-mannosaminyltransferase [Candidatus Daviesbacteria bacterium GW2011_GWB1_41_5]